MKILFDHPSPFLLAHGGFQIQIQRTKEALEELGVKVDYLKWWDEKQSCDLIHHFSPASIPYLAQARAKRIPVVMTTLFTETCNRPDLKLKLQGLIVRAILASPIGNGIKNQLQWKSFLNCDRNIVGLAAEATVLKSVYRVTQERISVVPLGLSNAFLNAGRGNRSENHLVCTGTITRRKNSLVLAKMAHAASVPILFIGKPYHPEDPYWLEFTKLIDDKYVKYHPHVESENEMINLLHSARGYVLLSEYENWCLSAHEAVACGLPLLIPDQKWSRERFGDSAAFFNAEGFESRVRQLRRFYEACLHLPSPQVKLFSWREIGVQLKRVYEDVLRTSR